ncbi:MAG: hypothetical protein HRU17_03995 [Polyangiaceae bacterium]|nr:hypothetical protein [Polyangiaceae bacterium]
MPPPPLRRPSQWIRSTLVAGRLTIGLTIGLASASGCALLGIGMRGPSTVAQGLEYESGNEHFDTFFGKLHEQQVVLEKTIKADDALRKNLALSLGLSPGTETADLGIEIHRRVNDLASKSVHFELQAATDSEPASLEVMGEEPSSAATRLGASIQASLNAAEEIREQMNRSESLVAKLEPQRQSLSEKAQSTFSRQGLAKLAEVEKNLEDAAEIISVIGERANKYSATAVTLIETLTEAVAPSAEEPDSAEEPEPKAKPAPVHRRLRVRPAPKATPAAQAPAPAPVVPAPAPATPPPAPAPSPDANDFEP